MRPRRGWERGAAARGLLLGATVVFLAGLVLLPSPSTSAASGSSSAGLSFGTLGMGNSRLAAYASGATSTNFALSVSASPGAICVLGGVGCPAGTGVTRVQLTATASQPPQPYWPDVQVVFVIETTAFDGVWGTDPAYGYDTCAPPAGSMHPLCEESNGVPVFVAHAQQIANSIQQANPHSRVSFAMVDYYDSWGSAWDDSDGPEYNVDIGQFIPAADFGAAVTSTFKQTQLAGGWYNWDQDLDNNFLDSSSITALYGAIVGSQLDWTDGAHHVIVWMGSTAPRDPTYIENYCVSPSEWHIWGAPSTCYDQSCEPAYAFAGGPSPMCEGWVHSQDGRANDSIAALARTAPACVNSVGGVCTVDTIDLATATTDPWSMDWPSQFSNIGGGPGGPASVEDVNHIVEAGCDLAAATGGTWDGPAWTSCPDGVAGSLQLVPHGPIDRPNLNNPQLLQAFRQVGFGPVYKSEFAHGAGPPIFTFVPFGSIVVAPDPQWIVACSTPTGFLASCQRTPTILRANGVTEYGWNWSTNATQNAIYDGDTWSASFFAQAAGPPYATVPIDACTTVACVAGGSGAVGGVFTRATFVPSTNVSEVVQSFPLANVQVQIAATTVVPTAPPPPPAVIIPPPIPAIVPVAAATPLVIPSQVGVGTVSVQALAGGLLAAAFIRITMKNRPIAMAVAQKGNAGAGSRFAESPPASNLPTRWE